MSSNTRVSNNGKYVYFKDKYVQPNASSKRVRNKKEKKEKNLPSTYVFNAECIFPFLTLWIGFEGSILSKILMTILIINCAIQKEGE